MTVMTVMTLLVSVPIANDTAASPEALPVGVK
jgi:hypothetical protein